MPAIDRIARNVSEIVESLSEIKAGDYRCLSCGHTAPAEVFEADTVPTCPVCKRRLAQFGYLLRDKDGRLRAA